MDWPPPTTFRCNSHDLIFLVMTGLLHQQYVSQILYCIYVFLGVYLLSVVHKLRFK